MCKFLLKLFIKDHQNIKDPIVRKKYGLLGSFFGLITNLILFVGKIILGVLMHMSSLVADAINNLSDLGNNGIAIFSFKIASKKPDKEHPYGHQRLEYIASLIIAMVIFSLGIIMIYKGIVDTVSFFTYLNENNTPPTNELPFNKFIITLVFLIVAILFKVMQARFYYVLGKTSDNMELEALSKDSLNDVISTTLVLVGLIVTKYTTYSIDCFFSIAVGIFVTISSISILKNATGVLIGQKPSDEEIKALIKLITSYKDVVSVHDLQMHTYGQTVYATIHVEVDASKDVIFSHKVIDEIERTVKSQLGVNLTIHMDPILIGDKETDYYLRKINEILTISEYDYHFHDFRIEHDGKKKIISFDLVIKNDEEKEEEIKNLIYTKLKDPNIILQIDFDSESSDFLKGSDVEEENR